MTNKQYEIFLLLSDNLSFTKTAEELFMSQSSVSREILALEKELGFSLFKRTLKSVELTSEGYEFKKSMAPLMNSIQTEISLIKNKSFHSGLKLRMGFFHIASLKKIPQAIGDFYKKYPSVFPEIHQANLNQLNSMFHSGYLDLIFAVKSVMEPKENDSIKSIYTGKMCATLPVTNPLSSKKSLTLSDINGYDILNLDSSSSSTCFKAFTEEVKHYCPNSHYINCSSTDEQEVYLKAGIGITLSTEYSFEPNPAYVQIPIKSKHVELLQSDYAIMWHNEAKDKHIDDFIEILQATFNKKD